MIDDRSVRAIESSNTDELIRIVDGHCEARSWDSMLELRARMDEAVTRGKQLWGVAEYIRYRLALDAPAAWAGPAVTEGPTRFTLGPLTEVAASTKTWSELEPHLAKGPERAVVAHERVVRGEALDDADVDPLIVELPLHLEPWEPAYETVVYKSDQVDQSTPPVPGTELESLTGAPSVVDDPDTARALLGLVDHWVETSNGRSQVAAVDGPAASAVHALGVGRAGLAPIPGSLALAHMAWAAASGGAHGRRRGAAAGRSSAWWAASELAGLEWPPEPTDLGEAVRELKWYLWSDGTPATGWAFRLAVESPVEGLAWALTATDAD